jgi:hypothetical protein
LCGERKAQISGSLVVQEKSDGAFWFLAEREQLWMDILQGYTHPTISLEKSSVPSVRLTCTKFFKFVKKFQNILPPKGSHRASGMWWGLGVGV